ADPGRDRGEHPRRDHPAPPDFRRDAWREARATRCRSSTGRGGARSHLRYVGANCRRALPVGMGRGDGVLLLLSLQGDVRQRSAPLRWVPRPMRPFVAGLVLAAAASTRLGQPHAHLPFGGTTMLTPG